MTHAKVDDIFYGWFFDMDLFEPRITYHISTPRNDKCDDEDSSSYDDDWESVTSIEFTYIDRGIESFRDFALELRNRFPNLTRLEFHQNYSYGETLSGFLYFIEKLKLQRLKIVDFQTKMFREMDEEDWRKVLHVMPENAMYSIESDVCDDTHYIDGKVFSS